MTSCTGRTETRKCFVPSDTLRILYDFVSFLAWHSYFFGSLSSPIFMMGFDLGAETIKFLYKILFFSTWLNKFHVSYLFYVHPVTGRRMWIASVHGNERKNTQKFPGRYRKKPEWRYVSRTDHTVKESKQVEDVRPILFLFNWRRRREMTKKNGTFYFCLNWIEWVLLLGMSRSQFSNLHP